MAGKAEDEAGLVGAGAWGRDDRSPAVARAVPAGLLPLVSAVIRRLLQGAAAAFEREMAFGRGFLWLPVLFGSGIVAYFALPAEPALPALLLATAAALAVARFGRGSAAVLRLAIALTAVLAGAAAMKLRTDLVAAPRLDRERSVTFTGWIEERTRSGNTGARLLIRVAALDAVPAAASPHRIRVTVRSGADTLQVGDGIAGLARLRPPEGPVLPGGYDFGRAQYYEGIGAGGFTYGAPKPAEIGPAPMSIRWREPIERLRVGIGARIEAALPGESGRIANALITGERGGISDATQEALRDSGLAHILAISGLHMALVAGTAFAFLRALFALSPALALRWPIKKWAASGALLVATAYLAISGGAVATQRSYIMMAVMLAAVLFDRRALSLRNVAIAALIVLAITPEAVLTASFQMSFAATAALVAGFEAVSERRAAAPRLRSRRGGVGPMAGRWLTAALLTSVLAGLATAPFSAYHFQRTAPLSLLANLAAMPAVTVLVMPPALAAALLMPFGLESLPLAVMELGLRTVVAVADWVAAWTNRAGLVRIAPAGALVLVALGLVWLCLWRERWRFWGAVPIVAGAAIAAAVRPPDIVFAADGTAAAVRAADGVYRILGGRGARFEIENWLRTDADRRTARDPSLKEGVFCDSLGCTTAVAGGGRVALVLDPRAFTEDCRAASVILTGLDAPPGCEATALVVDRRRLLAGGSHALYASSADAIPSGDPAPGPADARVARATAPSYTIVTARPQLRRPWMAPGFLPPQ